MATSRGGAAWTVLFAIVATAAAVGAAAAHLLFIAPAGAGGGRVSVSIAAGSDLGRIAEDLHKAGAIRNPLVFAAAARLQGLERRLRSGDYELDRSWSLPVLLRALLEGRGRTVRVTIPEGWRLGQIAARLEESGVTGAAVFLEAARDRGLLFRLGIPGPSAEGFLFPETYPFPAPATAEEVVRIMHRQFQRVWSELAAARGEPGPDLLETVTLASLIEKETSAPEERALVAAVFRNRLRRGMPLQSDPTVIYGIEDFDGNLRRSDLATPTPYNTYTIRGLPPGPIAAPGRAALQAALEPADADFLFFVSRGDGTHEFTRTLEEHNRAVRRYQIAGSKP